MKRGKKKLSIFSGLSNLRVGKLFALVRLKLLELRYLPHLEVRLVHDKTYAKGGAYKKWTDSKYSSAVHKTVLVSFVISFFVFSVMQNLLPFLNLGHPNVAQAGSNTVTWTSQSDFQSATTNSNVDFTTTPGSIQQSLPSYNPQGDGADGPLTVASSFNINTQTNGYNGRTAPDGVIWTITDTLNSASQSTIASSTTRPSGFAIGDEIMIINLKGTGTDYANVGLYEFGTISSLPTTTSIIISTSLTNSYDSRIANGNQKIVVQRVPNYTNITVNSYKTITANAWDGNSGGILAFRANGTVVNNGIIDMTGKGYRGGGGSTFVDQSAKNGEWPGGGLVNSGGTTGAGLSNLGGGGGGGSLFTGNCYTNVYSGGAGTEGPAGGGGGRHTYTSSGGIRSVGGNAGHGFVGLKVGSGVYEGGAGVGVSGGSGGTSLAVATCGNGYPGNGGSGGKIGDSTLLNTRAYLGAGGGGGGAAWVTGEWVDGSSGINGGGLIVIGAKSFNNSSTGILQSISSGNGAGGSIVLLSKSINNLGSITTQATGGGHGRTYQGYTSKSGNDPVYTEAYSQTYSYQSPSTLGSPTAGAVGLRADAGAGKAAKAATLTWNGTTTSAGQKILFKVRAGDTQAELDTNQCYGPTALDSGCADWTTAGKFFSQINGQANSATTIPSDIAAKRYIEVLVRMESDGGSTPVLNDVTLTYDTLEAPTNANLVLTKTDGTNLKDSSGATVTGGTPGAWTNSSTLRVTANSLTCTDCSTGSTNLRPEVEIKPVGSAFTGTTNLYAATAGNSYVDIPSLADGTSYHLQVRSIDDQGRVSGWTAYGANDEATADVSIDQVAPTGTVSINAGAQFATSTTVNLTLSASDTGGSNLAQMRLSNDGSTWSDWETYATTKANWDLSAYGGNADDGEKTVYIQYRDNAGNVSGSWTQTSDTDFNAGTKTNVTVDGDAITLTANTNPTLDPDNPDWIDGQQGTVLEGKQIYFQDLTGAWGAEIACTEPQCIVGLDPIYISNHTLVSPQTNPTVDFASYPAQNACKAVGGRLPYIGELSALYNGQALYGGNFGSSGHLSAVEESVSGAYMWDFFENFPVGAPKSYTYDFRCVRDLILNYSLSGSFTSVVKDLEIQATQIETVNFNTDVPANTSITLEARAGNTAIPDGTWTSYYTLTSGQNAPSELNNHRYLQYKATLTGDGSTTPTLNDINFALTISDSITLDTQPPTAFTISSPANNTYSSTEASPTFSWSASSGHSKYQLVIDDEVDKDNIDSGATSTTPTAPLSEGSYSWNIRAVDTAGNETLASNGPFTYTYDTTVPGNVQNLIAPQGQATTTSITVSWDAVTDSGSGIDHYTLERKRSDDDWTGSLYDTYVSYELSEITKTDTGLEVGRRYNYRIKAYDKAGLSSADYTTVDGFTTDTVDPSYPSAVNVTACRVDGPNCSTADNPNPKAGYETKITWTKATDSGVGVTGYKIYRTTVVNSFNESDFTLVGYVDIAVPGSESNSLTYYDSDTNNDATFTDTTYDPNTGVEGIQPIKSTASPRLNDYVTYYYRVNAIDESGNERDLIPGPLEYAVNYDSDPERTVDVTAPSVPADLTATATGVDTENNDPLTQGVTIDWSISTDTRTPGRTPAGNGSGVDYYSLYRASGDINGPTEGFVVIPEASNLEVATYPDKGLLENAYYYYKVMATDVATNTSELSSYAQVRTRDSSVPTTPTAVYVKSVTGDPNSDPDVGIKVNVSFVGSKIKVAENEVRGYRIYRSTTNLPTAAQWTALEPAYTISDLTIPGETQDPGDDGCSDYTLGGVVYGDNEGIRCFTDTVPTDATTYYYKVMSYGYNASNQENVESSLSSITPGTISSGWDTAPDATAPDQPAEVTVKDIHGNTSLYRNIVTWQMIATPERNGLNDFAKYQVYRYETFQGIGTATLIAEKTDIGDNYHVDGISEATADTDFSYYVVALDNANTAFKYATTGTPIINNYANSSGYSGTVAINPAIAKPTVSNTASNNVGVSSATISWTTDQPCDSLVEYRVKDTNTVKAAGGDRTTPVTSHTIGLVGLEKGKTYQYRIVSRNSLGNIDATAATTWGEFSTKDFSISSAAVVPTTTTATVTWKTNIAADSSVEYKPESSSETSNTAGDPSLNTDHEVVIKGLKPATTYTYKIRSVSADNYITDTSFATFTTKPYDSSQFTIAPNASNIAEQNITATSAKIVWNTAIETDTWVDFGTEAGNYTQSAGDETLNTVHVVELKNLSPGTTYYYRVRGKDLNLVEYTSKEYSFTAVLKPEIQNIKLNLIDSYTAKITFATNVDTEASVTYGQGGNFDLKAGTSEYKRNHEITLENLEDATDYSYYIEVKDKIGNSQKSAVATFSTPLDKEGPKVSDLKIDILPMGESDEFASVIISWNTNKPSTTKVEYDEGVISGKYGKSTIEDTSLNTSHTVIIKDLNPSTTYHFRIAGHDKRANKTNSQDYTFVTPEKNKSVWQLIVRSLEETFSWVSNVGGFFRGLGSKLN